MKLVDTDFLIDLQREWASEEPAPATAFLDAHRRVRSRVAGSGVQIVGGCCASGPEHVAAIRRAVSYP